MVYLDQNKWIDLSRAYHDRPDGAPFATTLGKVQDAVQHQSARFPLSNEHVIETMKMGDCARRHRLAEVMAVVSEGWTIAPEEQINRYEIRMAVPKALNKAVPIEIPVVFGRGVEFAFGQPVDANELTRALSSPDDRIRKIAIDVFGRLLASPDESLRKAGIDHYHSAMNATAHEADRVRNLVRDRTKNLQKRAFTARFVIDHIWGREVEFHTVLQRLGVGFEEFFNTLGSDGLEALFADMPTADVALSLRTQRHMQFQKPIEPNDLVDQSFLSVAIPYCDIVVTEGQWVDLAKRKKLDQKYHTQLLSDVNDLANILLQLPL